MKPFSLDETATLRSMIAADATVHATCVALDRPMHEVTAEADRIMEAEPTLCIALVCMFLRDAANETVH